jgi:hypothetical protein
VFVQVIKLPFDPHGLVTAVADEGVHLLVILRIRCREARVNVLWDNLVLLSSAVFPARYIGVLKRPILVQRAAYKVRAIRQVRGSRTNFNAA